MSKIHGKSWNIMKNQVKKWSENRKIIFEKVQWTLPRTPSKLRVAVFVLRKNMFLKCFPSPHVTRGGVGGVRKGEKVSHKKIIDFSLIFTWIFMVFHDFPWILDILPFWSAFGAPLELWWARSRRLLGVRSKTGYLGVSTMSLLSIALLKTDIYGV